MAGELERTLTALGNFDKLQGSLKESEDSEVSSVAKELGNLNLGSDEDADNTVILASFQNLKLTNHPWFVNFQFQRGTKLAQEANPKIVRQNVVVETAHHVLWKKVEIKVEMEVNVARFHFTIFSKCLKQNPRLLSREFGVKLESTVRKSRNSNNLWAYQYRPRGIHS